MKRLVALAVGFACICLTGVAAWRVAHSTYPYGVYHLIEKITYSGAQAGPTFVSDSWFDPQHQVERAKTLYGSQPTEQWIKNGVQYVTAPHKPTQITDLYDLAGMFSDLDWHWRQYLHGGYRHLGTRAMEHAVGRITRTTFAGFVALRFVTTDRFYMPHNAHQTTVWLDAATLVPLQVQGTYGDGSVMTDRYDVAEWIPPNTLPSNFFSPPLHQSSTWDRFVGWVRDRWGKR